MSLFCDKERKKELVQFQSYKNTHLNYKMFLMCNYICTVCISSVINAASSPGLGIPIEIGNSPGGVSYIMINKVYYCVYARSIVFSEYSF